MTLRLVWCLLPWIVMSPGRGSEAAAAQQLCSENTIASVCNEPTADSCLEMLHACGRDQTILGTFRAELKGLTNTQRYFVALAHFARATQTGSKGIRCDAIAEARESLDTYLYEAQDHFRKLGTYGSEQDMKATYHAARLRDQLKGEADCLESAHTIPSLRLFVRQTASQRIQDLFFGLKGNDGLDATLASVWKTLQDAMNSFVTSAAEIEDILQMTRSKLDAARDNMSGPGGTMEHLNAIAGATVANDGTVKTDSAVLEQTRSQIETRIAKPIRMEAETFFTLVGSSSPEDFGKARDAVSREARGVLGGLGWGIKHLTDAYLTADSPFEKAQTAIYGSTMNVNSPNNTLYSLHALWQEYGKKPGRNLCRPTAHAPWFCKPIPNN